jgi:predicted RNA binding protein YcfA (HicA-like mRNA interferase family)
MKPEELLARARRGDVRNVSFADLQRLLVALGFELDRVHGSHHLYLHPRIRERVNIQPVSGRQAKPYQVRQVADLAALYDLKVDKSK